VQWSAAEVEAMVGPMDAAAMETVHPFWARRLAETHGTDRWKRLTEQLVAFTRRLLDRPMTDADLARITCPTRVSAGDADRFFDIRHAVGVYRAIPGARLAVIPGLDHPIQGVNVARFTDDLREFMR